MLHLEIFVPRKGNTPLWGHEFDIKGRKLSKSCVFSQRASLVAQLVKNLPAMRETWVQSLGWEDPLFLQSRSGLRPTLPKHGKIRVRSVRPVGHVMSLGVLLL